MGNVVAKMDEILFSNENKDSNSDGNVFNEPKCTGRMDENWINGNLYEVFSVCMCAALEVHWL